MKAEEFLKLLYLECGKEYVDLPKEFIYLMTEFDRDYDIERRNAAVIAHAFIKNVLKISDTDDSECLKEANKLADLYDCRVCVNAISQIYARGIMKNIYTLESGRKVFGGRELLLEREAADIAKRIKKLK